MNGQTKEIAELLGCSIEHALKIQQIIDDGAMLDWSECTNQEFKDAVYEAQVILRKRNGEN
jgi:hypothetical protein